MRTLCLFLAFSTAIVFSSPAQTLCPFVVASSGDNFSNSTGILSFTIAEMTMVETFSENNNFFLNQGFHSAPEEVSVEVPTFFTNKLLINYYPNPTRGVFYVTYEEQEDNSKIIIQLNNMIGSKILTYEFLSKRGKNLFKLDVSSFPQGIYLMYFTVFQHYGAIINDVAKICYEL